MADHAYTPRWVPVEVSWGCVRALAFTANRQHVRYVGKLDELETARIVATAAGQMGTCADYLHRTVDALETHGLRDERLMALQARVRALR
jgi:cation transport protein ChaC